MDRLMSMEVFAQVAEQGSFSAAAAKLGLSATMVGKHIRFLEHRLAARLINRTTRRQSLTEAGAAYLDRCKQLLLDSEEADACVQQLRRTPRGLLRVSCPVTFGTERLVSSLAEYLRQYPDVSIELALSDRAVDLVENGFEAAFLIGKLEDSTLIARPLQPYRTVICASPEYLRRHGVPQSPAALSQHNCLGFMYWDRRDRWRMIGPDTEATVPVRGNLTVNNGQALRQAALAGLGIIMQPEALVADDLQAGRLRKVLPTFTPPPRPMHLVYLPDRQLTPKIRSFVDFMAERFGGAAKAVPVGRRAVRH